MRISDWSSDVCSSDLPEKDREMTLPTFTMRQLIEAGVHFGHQTHRWNPKMKPFLFGERNNVHIIDLQQSVPMLHRALQAVRDVTAGGGRVLFVGTKRQASRSEEHTSELQSLMRTSYAVFCLKKKTNNTKHYNKSHKQCN